MGGALTKGLTITLQKFIDEYKSEYSYTGFNQTYRNPNQPTIQQREQYMASNYILNVIEMVQEEIKASIKGLTNEILSKIDAILYGYLACAVLINVVCFLLLYEKYQRQLNIDKNMIMIIPQMTYINSTHIYHQILQIIKCTWARRL